MPSRNTIIFDASAINRLAADPEVDSLVGGMKAGFFVRLTETSIAEVISTKDVDRRVRLLTLLRRLTSRGDCIQPFDEIVQRGIRRFERNPTAFDWQNVPVRFPLADSIIVRHGLITDEMSKAHRDQLRVLREGFEEIYAEMRPGFADLFKGLGKTRPSLREIVRQFSADGGPLWALGDVVYGKVVPSAPENKIRDFYMRFPPFRALVLALCVALYDRCIRHPMQGPSMRAGRLDMFTATYLPYCEFLITADDRQLTCLQTIAVEGDFKVSVRSYQNFRSQLMTG